ncbi:MAG: hypothetical protein K5Q68_04780 [Roseococcus sp.]|nr:hypothetical protein [Roseococcus sp.]
MNAAHASPPLSEIFHALLAAGWRRRYVILLPLLLLPILGGLIGSFVPHSYETRMSVLVQEPGRFNPFLEDLSVRSNLRDRMDGLRALLTSRHVLLGVAEDLGMIQPGASESEQSRAVSSLSSSVSVQLIGQEMVELRYRARRPEGIDRVLARIGQRFIERVRGPEDASLRDSVSFLGGQIQDAQNALNQAEQALSSFKSTHAAQLPDMRAANLQRLAQLREQLAEREVRLAGAEAEIASISTRLLQTDPVLGRLEQDIVATRGELALLRSRYTDAHSRVQAVLNRAESLEQERDRLLTRSGIAMDDARLRNIAAVSVARGDGAQPLLVSQIAILDQARARLGQLRGETENLRAAVADLSRRIADSGEVERELRGLERDVAVQADLTQQLRRRFETARVTADLARQQAPERIKVIDRPFEPTAPTKPMTIIFALAGIAAGLALGMGLAALFELMDGSVRGIRGTEKLLGVPVLARLPRIEGRLVA